jgi:hypothetical protein
MAPGSDAAASYDSTPTTAAPAPKVVFSQSGSGIHTTQPFQIDDGWTLKYTFDCSNFGLGKGNFMVNVANANGSFVFRDDGPNELAAKGANSDYEPEGGLLILKVNSECSWTVQSVGTVSP